MGDLLIVLQGRYTLQHRQIDCSSLGNGIKPVRDKPAHMCLIDKSLEIRQTDTTQLTVDSEESVKLLAQLCHSRSPAFLQVHNREDEGMTHNYFDQQQQKKGLDENM